MKDLISELNLSDNKLSEDMALDVVQKIVVAHLLDKSRKPRVAKKQFDAVVKKHFDLNPPIEQKVEQVTSKDRSKENFDYSELGQRDSVRFKKLLGEAARRKMEALKIYEPIEIQQNFHSSKATHRLVRGGNRSGKTTVAAVELSRAVCGVDPFLKYPLEGGRAFCVGRNLDHIGNVMWRKLGRAGAFRIIRDLQTKQWRTYKPWEISDFNRFHLTKPSPPLIPKRLIKKIAWENKAKNIPKLVVLNNGWEISFYSSEGKPPQGSDIDIFWLDEEIVDPDWHPELSARILDRKGCGFWSATPQTGTEKLLELHERALTEREKHPYEPNDRTVDEFVIILDDNPHIGDKEKKEFAEGMSEDERKVRISGEFAINSLRVFPEFSKAMHGVEFFQIPNEWTRYAVVDPGRQVCCVLFFAIPPLMLGNTIYLYDELYIYNCDAEQFGQRMAQKSVGQQFEKFVIDMHGGRISDIGSGLNVEQQYSRSLRKYRVYSASTGSGFQWGSDDVQGGIEAARSFLKVREDGSIKLKVFPQCPNFMWEIERYRYKKEPRGYVTDRPEDRGRVHAMACFRYMAMANLKFVQRHTMERKDDTVLKALKAKVRRMNKQNGGLGMINLGPGKEKV